MSDDVTALRTYAAMREVNGQCAKPQPAHTHTPQGYVHKGAGCVGSDVMDVSIACGEALIQLLGFKRPTLHAAAAVRPGDDVLPVRCHRHGGNAVVIVRDDALVLWLAVTQRCQLGSRPDHDLAVAATCEDVLAVRCERNITQSGLVARRTRAKLAYSRHVVRVVGSVLHALPKACNLVGLDVDSRCSSRQIDEGQKFAKMSSIITRANAGFDLIDKQQPRCIDSSTSPQCADTLGITLRYMEHRVP